MFPKLKSSAYELRCHNISETKFTVGCKVEIFQEVISVRLAQVVSVQIEGREADCRPEHHFPIDLAYEFLETKISSKRTSVDAEKLSIPSLRGPSTAL